MEPFELPFIEPTRVEAVVLPDAYDLSFEGFGAEAFAVLERLRAHPHVEQYRKEKDAVARFLQAPFRRYRDDLVVNWVLPNRLAFETERNVFSRLLKNDFGAGGCHHHLWLSFYRPGRRRLTDFQLTHSIAPDGFTVGLYVGDYAKDLVRTARGRILAEPDRFRALVNPLLMEEPWTFSYYHRGVARTTHGPLAAVPSELARAEGLWIGRLLPRADVLALGPGLVRYALQALARLWPLYRFYGAASDR